MHRPALLLLAPLLLAAASAPVIPSAETADARLNRARTEAQQAKKRLETLEAAAAKTGDRLERLRAEQAAAAAAIEKTEADIGESDARLRLARAQILLVERRLAHQRAPLAALLAGLATMGRQPPILVLADQGSVDEMIRVKALLDATMPVMEQRTFALRVEVEGRRKLGVAAEAARAELARSREELDLRRQRFAELEAKASEQAAMASGQAFGAGERVLAADELLALADSDADERRAARSQAGRLRELGFAAARPFRGDSALPPQDFGYSLPVSAPLLDGLGTVNRAGVASRGLRFDTPRGAPVIVPADGEILFAAPFRSQDGIVIIEHPGGWTSLLIGVATDRAKGSEVRRGEFLGRTLGPLGVELRRNGVTVSPALIAASSVPLSNGGDRR